MHRPTFVIARNSSRSMRCGSLLAWLTGVVLVAGHATSARANSPCDAVGKACPRPINAESARGIALGTGVRASAISTSALAYNPAALVLGKSYHIEGLVDYMADMKTVALGGAVVDSSTSRLAAGLAFRGLLSGDTGVGGIDARLGIAFPLADAISIGLAARYISISQAWLINDGVTRSVSLAKGFTLDASVRIAPIQQLQLHFGTYNLIRLSSELGLSPGAKPVSDAYAPLILSGGAAVTIANIAVIGGDALFDLTSYSSTATTLGAGAEVLVANIVPLRAGYSYDLRRTQHALSLGVGYTDRSVGFDLSLRQDLGGFGDTRVVGAFRFFVR